MKLHIAHSDDDRQGGGWSWISNMKKAVQTYPYHEADTYLIPSPSICSKEEVDQAQADGKRIVLRVDNIVRNSRNRNTGMSRMQRFAQQAHAVIYQSQFARQLLMPYLQVDGAVILNAVDEQIFNDRQRIDHEKKSYLYSRVNRDETKNWEMARYIYQCIAEKNPDDCILNIVGAYSGELQEYNFDFYQGEYFKYWGVVSQPEAMAAIYKLSDYLIYTFWNDACSNTLIEALCCGLHIIDHYNMRHTGGAAEILEKFEQYGSKYFNLNRMADEYMEVLHGL